MTKHGHRSVKPSLTYVSWRCMVRRCTDFAHPEFSRYAGKLDASFVGEGGFARFIAAVGERPDREHTLDRIDPHGSYEPGNLRWACKKTQRRNVREYERVFYGRTVSEWAKLTGISPGAVRKRLERKTPHEKIFPVSLRV